VRARVNAQNLLCRAEKFSLTKKINYLCARETDVRKKQRLKKYDGRFQIRRNCGGRGTRRLRGGTRCRANGRQDLPHHDGPEQSGADVVQSGHRRHRQRTNCPRGGRAGRTDGTHHRPRRHSIPHAQPLKGPRDVEPPRTVRPNAVQPRHALRPRKYAQPPPVARRGRARAGEGRASFAAWKPFGEPRSRHAPS